MELTEHRCKRCGGALSSVEGNRWKCQYCGCIYDDESATRNTQTMRELLDEAKQELVNNLRRSLYEAVNAKYISSKDVKNACVEIKKYLPDDFQANFYEVAVSNNPQALTKYIRKIDIESNYDEIECAVRFLIKSLQMEYLLELNNLVERAYKNDKRRFEEFSTQISKEAVKINTGVYETKLPREVFVAYSSKDMDKVSELVEMLEGQGLQCFVAARNLRHGQGAKENYNAALQEAMDYCKSFVFVSSLNSRSLNCDALQIEIPFIRQKDIDNAPLEYRNNYKSIPSEYKKPRIEYYIEESRGFNAADSITKEFFDGYERVYSPKEVAKRLIAQLVSIPGGKSSASGNRKGGTPKKNDEIKVDESSFRSKLAKVESKWQVEKSDSARAMIDSLIKNDIEANHYHDKAEALMLRARIYSNDYKNLKNSAAQQSISDVISLAKAHKDTITLSEIEEYGRYRAAVMKSRLKIVIIAVAAAAVVAGSVIGIVLAAQDPLVEMHVTGNPSKIEVEYGESILSQIKSITMVSKKGKETEVEVTNAMITGYDPTLIGSQNVTITYGDMTITVNVNTVKYTLDTPASIKFESGRISWDSVSNAQSYTLKINDDVISDIVANTYEDYDFSSTGYYSIQVKAVADGSVGMDSAYTDELALIKLAQASNLKLKGTSLTWDAVFNCKQYDIYINGTKVTTSVTNSYTVLADSLSSGPNSLYVVPSGASNLKLISEATENELANYDHNAELKVFKYRQASGLTWSNGILSWDAVADGASYAIYLNDEILARTNETQYTLDQSAVTAGESKIYVIPENAVNITTEGTEDTDYENNSVVTVTKLPMVTGVKIANKELSWNAVEGATEYEIYLNGTPVTKTTSTSYAVVIDNSKESTNVYTVKAYGAFNTIPSQVSEESATIGSLPAPSNLALEGAVLSWSAVEQASGYQVYAGDSLVATLEPDTLSINMLGKLKKGVYDLTVVALASAENLISSAKSEAISYDVSETIVYITSEEDLKNITLDLGALYVLGNDITLTGEWTPIGSTSSPFVGRFSGGGHKIINLTVNATSAQGTGLFAVIDEGGIVEDITFENASCTSASYSNVGIVAGINRGTISRIVTNGTVTSDGDNAGGLVGKNYGSITDCENNATVSGKKYVGGIAGNCEVSGFNITLTGCKNSGNVTGSLRAGGIFGSVTIINKVSITKMTNSGEITSTGNYAGGICGYILGSSNQPGTLESCENSGKIVAENYVAGCFGFTSGYIIVTVDNTASPSLNCTNSGTVTANSGNKTHNIYLN